MEEDKQEYIVYATVRETPDVVTLKLISRDGGIPQFIPGQYITVYFPETGAPEGKAYSISSAPHEGFLHISVKAMGEFSGRLTSLVPGDVITASSPYGYFYTESDNSDLVLISGGIGIAPFRGMIVNALEEQKSRRITLLFSNKTIEDIVFKKDFDALESGHNNFHPTYFITRQKDIYPHMVASRIGEKYLSTLISSVLPDRHTEFFLCGSISFTRDMWRILRSLGVMEENISTEAFF